MNLSIFQKLFTSHLLAIAVVTLCMGMYLYMQTTADLLRQLQAHVLENVIKVSQRFDAQQLHAIRTSADSNTPAYRSNIMQLRQLLTENTEISDIYIMRREGNEAHYVLNPDTVATPNIGATHQPYIAEMIDGFYQPSVDKQMSSNQWGHFLSAYAPIKNGRGQYLIAIDIHADHISKQYNAIQRTFFFTFLLSLLSATLFSFIVSRYYTQRIAACMQRTQTKMNVAQANKNKGDELKQFIIRYESTLDNIHESNVLSKRAQKQTQEQLNHLERHFKLHTHELEQSNEQLRSEIEQRTKIEKELAKVACTDELTGLINRRAIMRILHKRIKHYGQQPQDFCILLVDIADFKKVNHQLGMAAADQVLVQFATFLRGRLNLNDSIGRWSGSDFILLMNETSVQDAQDFAHELYTTLQHYHFYSGQVLLKIHTGISVYRATMEAEQVINYAATALMQAKQRGSYCAVYDEQA